MTALCSREAARLTTRYWGHSQCPVATQIPSQSTIIAVRGASAPITHATPANLPSAGRRDRRLRKAAGEARRGAAGDPRRILVRCLRASAGRRPGAAVRGRKLTGLTGSARSSRSLPTLQRMVAMTTLTDHDVDARPAEDRGGPRRRAARRGPGAHRRAAVVRVRPPRDSRLPQPRGLSWAGSRTATAPASDARGPAGGR